QSKQFFCSSSNLTQSTTNVVTATFVPPGSPPGTPPTTTPPSQATANVGSLVVKKEVCESSNATDCQAGGAGPWVQTASVPSGGTAYWRITVTNTDGVAITGITLKDTVAPSCVTAAGTFDLAVGASKQFFCSNSNVTRDTTNVVTASFVPPGSPPGTQPTTTPPAQATATVPSLAVKKEVCQSTKASDCTQAGNGPWSDIAAVPMGGTAYWRITVTNTGTTDIAGITLNDNVANSCVNAAGSFDLAAGASKQFFCSSSNITQDTTNTVTAQFTPPGSTKPVITPPSQATATVAALIVNKEVCLSSNTTNCAQDGPGPWGKTVTLQRGGPGNATSSPCSQNACPSTSPCNQTTCPGTNPCDQDKCTAFWKITVTNTSGTNITGITLNDQQEASCLVASGTFDLAAGQSKSFFCSSTIASDTTNTVTASFVPPGSPVGTQPITTAPSSATAKCPPPCNTCTPGATPGHEEGHHPQQPGHEEGHHPQQPGHEEGHHPQQPGHEEGHHPQPQPAEHHTAGGLAHTGAQIMSWVLIGTILIAFGTVLALYTRSRRARR
ncbi:hypothetical protein AB0Q99_31430, partial [Kitasatospora sp. NPDC086791]